MSNVARVFYLTFLCIDLRGPIYNSNSTTNYYFSLWLCVALVKLGRAFARCLSSGGRGVSFCWQIQTSVRLSTWNSFKFFFFSFSFSGCLSVQINSRLRLLVSCGATLSYSSNVLALTSLLTSNNNKNLNWSTLSIFQITKKVLISIQLWSRIII